jgi:hypothetical protein
MALNTQLTDLAANTEIDALTALLNNGYLDLYDGTQPATGDVAVSTQTRLASLRFGNPAFAAGVAGVAIANAIASDTDSDASGTATWFRAWKSDHTTPVLDGSVAAVGGVANLLINSPEIRIHARTDTTGMTLSAAKS